MTKGMTGQCMKQTKCDVVFFRILPACDQTICEVPETRGGGESGKEYMNQGEALQKT
jgi:hypothetical protein